MSSPVSSTAPTQVQDNRTTFQRLRNSFTNRGNKLGRNARNFTLKSLNSFTKIPGVSAVLTRFGIVSPTAVKTAAQISAEATAERQDAEKLAMMGAVASGIGSAVTLFGIASTGPLAPAFFGFYILLTVVLRTRGINRELRANLEAIQGEADSMFMITCVVEAIAKENGINLNTKMVRIFLNKLTDFVTLLAGPDAMKAIENNRTKLQSVYVESKQNMFQTEPTAKTPQNRTEEKLTERNTGFNRWNSFFSRTMAPGEYLRILIREVIILHIFFSIMMSEFDLFMRAKGDLNKKDWVNTPAYRLLLASNKSFMTMRMAKGIDISPEDPSFEAFYKPLEEIINNDTNQYVSQENLNKEIKGLKEQISKLITPDMANAAVTDINNSVVNVTNTLGSSEVTNKIEVANKVAVNEVTKGLEEKLGMNQDAAAAAATELLTLQNEKSTTEGPALPNTVASGGGRRRTRKYRAKKNNRRN